MAPGSASIVAMERTLPSSALWTLIKSFPFSRRNTPESRARDGIESELNNRPTVIQVHLSFFHLPIIGFSIMSGETMSSEYSRRSHLRSVLSLSQADERRTTPEGLGVVVPLHLALVAVRLVAKADLREPVDIDAAQDGGETPGQVVNANENPARLGLRSGLSKHGAAKFPRAHNATSWNQSSPKAAGDERKRSGTI